MDQILQILGSLGFNWHVALANFINFLIILFILNKFFFGKIGKTIAARAEVIERGLSYASDAEKALANAEEEKKKIVKEAKVEGHQIVEEAKGVATSIAEGIKSNAETEAATLLSDIANKEASLKESVEKEFAQRVPSIVAALARKALSENMTPELNNKIISASA